MNRLCIATRGATSWRDRLTRPDTQWKREFSALETAVSWEFASSTPAGLPAPILDLFAGSIFGKPELMLAIAEHKVPLAGRGGDSQCDVWALLKTSSGLLSLSVEAKAKEPFGQDGEPLARWLAVGISEDSRDNGDRGNREVRWNYIKEHLPDSAPDGYSKVAYQLLHRCAAAVIEAKRLNLPNAGFIVQAFRAPDESFDAFSELCRAAGVEAERGRMKIVPAGKVTLGIGWADCPLATDEQIAAVV